jgi:hypothetical protein
VSEENFMARLLSIPAAYSTAPQDRTGNLLEMPRRFMHRVSVEAEM